MAAWEEVSTAKNENRRELVLQGSEISKRIDENGLDANIFKLVNLNHLEISGTSLSSLEAGAGELVNLTSLLLCNNKLTSIPAEIVKLSKLKTLNLSNNQLEAIPVEIGTLSKLDTLNLSMNQLTDIPSVGELKYLRVFNVSNNKLTALPDGLFDSELVYLSQISASDNEITELAPEVSNLPQLDLLDLSNNRLTTVPTSLSVCHKLKNWNLKDNKLKDRKLCKMVEQGQTKSSCEYLHNLWKKENPKAGKDTKDTEEKKKKKGKQKEETEEVKKGSIRVKPLPKDATGVEITVTPAVISVRQYIVCCVIRNLDLSSKFKEFITLQTKLHKTVCKEREAATIATHDMKSVKLPLKYNAMSPGLLKIQPLGEQEEVSGEKLVEDLRRKAEEVRKEKKRNKVSGIYKYKDLLAGKTQYPCLVDREGFVISFPPITNSDKTKMSKETTDILVEVTSSTSLDTCKKVLDEMLYEMLAAGIASKTIPKTGGATAKGSDESDDGAVFQNLNLMSSIKTLIVEQAKVVDSGGTLKVLYPSIKDLPLIEVIRE